MIRISLSVCLSLPAVHSPGAASERCSRHHPLLVALFFHHLFDPNPLLRGPPGFVPFLPGHAEPPSRQAGRHAGSGVSIPRDHPEEADRSEPTRQRCRSASKTSPVLSVKVDPPACWRCGPLCQPLRERADLCQYGTTSAELNRGLKCSTWTEGERWVLMKS